MSIFHYSVGQNIGYNDGQAAGKRAARAAEDNADEWMAYAKRLEKKVAELDKQWVRSRAQVHALSCVYKETRAAFGLFSATHPLLKPDWETHHRRMIEHAATDGYIYDPVADTLRKK